MKISELAALSRPTLAARLSYVITERDEAYTRIHVLRREIDRIRNRGTLIIVVLAVALVIVGYAFWSHFQNQH